MPTFTGTSNADVITPTLVSPGVIAQGAAFPGAGADSLNGGGGNDTLDGGGGPDTVQGGAGNDLIRWSFGSGNDVIDGGADSDTLVYLGNATQQDPITLGAGAASGHILIQGLSGSLLDVTNVENIVVTPLLGTDVVTLNDTWDAAPATLVTVDLGVGGAPDGQADTVTLNGSAQPDGLFFDRAAGAVERFSDRQAVVRIENADVDRLNINGGGGADLLEDVRGETPGTLTTPHISLNGGDGDDVAQGLDGDTVSGGNGTDSLRLEGGGVMDGGAGSDALIWLSSPGASLVAKGGEDGAVDRLTAQMNVGGVSLGSGGDVILRGSDGASAVSHNIGEIILDSSNHVDGVQDISIGDLSASKVTTLLLDLSFSIDQIGETRAITETTVSLTGGNAANVIGVSAGPGEVTVGGLTNPSAGAASLITVKNPGDHDAIVVDGGAGNDAISVISSQFGEELDLHGGDGADTITASFSDGDSDGHRMFGDNGADSLNGGAGGGFLIGGAGNDTLASGGAAEFIFNHGEGGSDVVLGFVTLGDRIVLNGAVDASLGAAVADHHIFELNGNTVVTDGTSTIVTLVGVHLATLSDGNFVFN